MKRLIVAVTLVGVLVALLASTALASAPAAGPVGNHQGGPRGGAGAGIHTPGTGAGMGTGQRRSAPEWAGPTEEVATLLGMTQDEIQTQRLAGQSLVQIAASKNVGKDTLVSTILNAKKATLDSLVAASKLTQAQADAMLSNMQAQVTTMVERASVGRPENRPNAQGLGIRGGRWNQ